MLPCASLPNESAGKRRLVDLIPTQSGRCRALSPKRLGSSGLKLGSHACRSMVNARAVRQSTEQLGSVMKAHEEH